MLIGNVTSLGLSMIVSTLGSLVWPENYSFDETRALHAHAEATEEIDPPTSSAEEELEEVEAKGAMVPKINSETSSLAEGGGQGATFISYKREFNLACSVSIPVFISLLVRRSAAHCARQVGIVIERKELTH
jgi:hypothetical protein